MRRALRAVVLFAITALVGWSAVPAGLASVTAAASGVVRYRAAEFNGSYHYDGTSIADPNDGGARCDLSAHYDVESWLSPDQHDPAAELRIGRNGRARFVAYVRLGGRYAGGHFTYTDCNFPDECGTGVPPDRNVDGFARIEGDGRDQLHVTWLGRPLAAWPEPLCSIGRTYLPLLLFPDDPGSSYSLKYLLSDRVRLTHSGGAANDWTIPGPNDPLPVVWAETQHATGSWDFALTLERIDRDLSGSFCIPTSPDAGSGSARSLRTQSSLSSGPLGGASSPAIGYEVLPASSLRARLLRAGDGCGFRHQLQRHKFRNCAAFATWMNRVRWIAFSVPDLRYRWVAPIRKKRPVDVEITYSVNATTAFVGQPVFRWKRMTPEEKQAVGKFEKDVLVHEHGHLTVAKRYAAEHTRKFTARNRREAKALIKKDVEDVKAGARSRELEYDNVTHHGITQREGPSHGFPGGDNTVFTCP